MRGFTTIFERFVSFRRVPMRIVVITALASYVLQLGAILQGQPLFIIALYTLVPWIPAFLFEGLWKFEHYNWVAVFAIVAALQVGHLGEHTFQVVQLSVLNGTSACPPPVDSPANAERAVQMGLRPANVEATGRSSSTIIKAEGNLVTAHPAGQVAEASTFYEVGGKAAILARGGLIQNVFNLSPKFFFIRP